MLKICFVFASLLLQGSFAIAGTLNRDTTQFDAEDAIRYAQFIDFHRFGENWSAQLDSTGNTWLVKAEHSYMSKKVIKNQEGMILCDTEKGCLVNSARIILMDKRNGKVLGRKRYTQILSN